MKREETEARRRELLGISGDYSRSCIYHHFAGLTVENLKALIDENLIDPEGCQNDSPTTQEFYELMEKHPEITAHGYVVGPIRDDYRIALEGVQGPFTRDWDTLVDFVALCRCASKFSIDEEGLYAWWD